MQPAPLLDAVLVAGHPTPRVGLAIASGLILAAVVPGVSP